jgi:hypothetical protein
VGYCSRMGVGRIGIKKTIIRSIAKIVKPDLKLKCKFWLEKQSG